LDEGFRMFQKFAGFLRWADNNEDHDDRKDR
jgi:hypothetical protein